MRIVKFLLIFLSFSLIVNHGTVFAQKNGKYLDPSTEIKGIGFTIVSPQEERWFIGIQNPGQLGLGKIGPSKYESYAVNINFFQLPQFNSEQDFADYIKKVRVDERKTSKRHKVIENKEEFPCSRERCLSYYTLCEDRGVKNLPGNQKYMLLEMQGFYCFHTKGEPNIGVEVAYSQRFFPENKDPDFEKKAKYALEQIRFVEAK